MRTLARLLIAVAVCSPALSHAEQCVNGVQVRKEFRTITAGRWQRFVSAVRLLNADAPPTRYDSLVEKYIETAPAALGYAPSFPAQRKLLREFERRLQRIDPGLTVPYWNWSLDWQAPELSPIFDADHLGGNGDETTHVVTDGLLPNWAVSYPVPHLLTRDFNDQFNPFFSPAALNAIVSASTTYDEFRSRIELIPAGRVHNSIGGDMASTAAPNDPLFWLHIAFVDKLWADWQKLDRARLSEYGGVNSEGSPAQLTDVIPGYQAAIRTVMNTRKLCYRYE